MAMNCIHTCIHYNIACLYSYIPYIPFLYMYTCIFAQWDTKYKKQNLKNKIKCNFTMLFKD